MMRAGRNYLTKQKPTLADLPPQLPNESGSEPRELRELDLSVFSSTNILAIANFYLSKET